MDIPLRCVLRPPEGLTSHHWQVCTGAAGLWCGRAGVGWDSDSRKQAAKYAAASTSKEKCAVSQVRAAEEVCNYISCRPVFYLYYFQFEHTMYVCIYITLQHATTTIKYIYYVYRLCFQPHPLPSGIHKVFVCSMYNTIQHTKCCAYICLAQMCNIHRIQ